MITFFFFVTVFYRLELPLLMCTKSLWMVEIQCYLRLPRWCSLIIFFVFYKSFYITLGTRGFFSRATRSFVVRRPTRLRPKAEDTSGEVFRGGHFLRLNRNRKPRIKSLWHPGYFYISQSREACCKLWLLFNASVTSELSLVFIRSDCDLWRRSSDLSCCSNNMETCLEIPLKSILASSLQRSLCSLKGFPF